MQLHARETQAGQPVGAAVGHCRAAGLPSGHPERDIGRAGAGQLRRLLLPPCLPICAAADTGLAIRRPGRSQRGHCRCQALARAASVATSHRMPTYMAPHRLCECVTSPLHGPVLYNNNHPACLSPHVCTERGPIRSEPTAPEHHSVSSSRCTWPMGRLQGPGRSAARHELPAVLVFTSVRT